MSISSTIDPRLLQILRCPVTGLPLKDEANFLVSADNSHRYSVFDGIPCLIPDSLAPTHAGYRAVIEQNRSLLAYDGTVDEVALATIQAMLVATCGNLFRGAILRDTYPIPDLKGMFISGWVLDVGCNWGRWSIAGAVAGNAMIGIDIHLESLLAARWLSRKLTPHNEPLWVLGDARALPFCSDTFDGVFSYSVVQHFSRANALLLVNEVKRVLKPRGTSVVQMPNRSGLKHMLSLRRLRHAGEGSEFDIRYYSVDELLTLFGVIGKSAWRPDCFLGLNVHARDRHFVPASKRWIVHLAEGLLRASENVPPLRRLADSVFVMSIKN